MDGSLRSGWLVGWVVRWLVGSVVVGEGMGGLVGACICTLLRGSRDLWGENRMG